MKYKLVTGIVLTMFLASTLTVVFDVAPFAISAGSSSAIAVSEGVGVPSVLVSQGGYMQKGLKKAVITCSHARGDLTTFYLKNSSGSYVYSSTLYYWGYYNKWKTYYWIADFTDFQIEGNYSVVVPYEGGSAESFRFPISNITYMRLLKMAQKWFYYQRCGYEVPGWHDPCHLDDGNRWGSWANATGGWHDAGDHNKYVYSTVLAVFALETLYEDYPSTWNEYGSAEPDTLEEAEWGIEWLLKMLTPDGYLWSAIFSGFNYWGIPERETDNIPETGDERPFTIDQWGDVTWAEAFFSAAAAKLAYLKVSEDSGYSGMLRQKAELTFNAVLSKGSIVASSLDAQAGLLLASTYLYLLTQNSTYLSEAHELVDSIIASQMPEGWFAYPGSNTPVFNTYIQYSYITALGQFALKFPNDPRVSQIKDALRKFMNHVCLMTQETPFGQMPILIMYQGSLQVWNFMPPDIWGGFYQGLDSIYAATAYSALLANKILGVNISYTEAAQNQILWILGMNPVDYSMMASVGRNPAGYHTRYNSIPSHNDGKVPGGIVNGICGNFSDYYWFDDSAGTPAWQTTEYWLPHNAWFIMAIEHLLAHNFTAPYGPRARFNYAPLTPYINVNLTIDASGSLPGWNGTHFMSIVSCEWDFGDGTPKVTQANPVITHNYTVLGTYTVTLNVTDSQGCWKTTSKTIEIHPPTHDAAIINIIPSANEAYPSWKKAMGITVTVINEGSYVETFPVALCWNNSNVIDDTFVTLNIGETKALTYTWTIPTIPFAWPYPTYVLSANATLPSDNNPADNTITDGTIKIKWPGDADGDGQVWVKDLFLFGKAWCSKLGEARYNQKVDFDGDGQIWVMDLFIFGKNWGKNLR